MRQDHHRPYDPAAHRADIGRDQVRGAGREFDGNVWAARAPARDANHLPGSGLFPQSAHDRRSDRSWGPHDPPARGRSRGGCARETAVAGSRSASRIR